jgi:hypothetical protein
VASNDSDPSNIGFVLYTKSHARGTLNARWMPIVDFSRQGPTLEVYNPTYAALMSRATPPSGSRAGATTTKLPPQRA